MGERVLIVAGEASGDAQASRLVKAMREQRSDLTFYGVGGEQMRAAGVETIFDAASLSVMGFSEAVGGFRQAWRCYRTLVNDLESPNRPDLLILVDFPEFNLILARKARKAGVKVFYYVSPQVWAWRRGRIRKICQRVDRMVVLFPFEQGLYESGGLETHFVGHPLAEDVAASREPSETRERHRIPQDRPLLVLMPGSRRKEVHSMLPVMLEGAAMLKGRATVALARAPGIPADLVEDYVAASGLEVAIIAGDTYNLMSAGDVAVVTSGTVTVECALMGLPMVVVYRMSRMSYLLARALVKVPFIAMPNIILDRQVVPELVQAQASADGIAEEVSRYLDDEAHRRRTKEELAGIRSSLVLPGAADRAARLAVEMMA